MPASPRAAGRTKQGLWGAGSPRHVLHSELVCSHGDAVDELHRAPQAVELHALVHVHHPIAGQGPAPDGVVQEGADPRQDDLEHGQAAAEAFFGQQVPFPRDCYLLRWRETKHKILVIQRGSQTSSRSIKKEPCELTARHGLPKCSGSHAALYFEAH